MSCLFAFVIYNLNGTIIAYLNFIPFVGHMPRTKGRDGRVIRHEHARRGMHRIMHGRLAIELGGLLYTTLSTIQHRISNSYAPSYSLYKTF